MRSPFENCFLIVLIILNTGIFECLGIARIQNNSLSRESIRHPKLFPFVVAIVKIPPEKCETGYGESVHGVCYEQQDCIRQGGITAGECADGYGTCCLFLAKCGDVQKTVTIKSTHAVITSDLTRKAQCRFIIPKRPGICQIRLDFNKFSLSQPVNGDCTTESFVIADADNLDGFALCGQFNKTEHLYLHYGSSDSITLTSNTLDLASTYVIQMTMIKCNEPEKAPDGCTQYYSEDHDQVRSFNYPEAQLNSQKYMVCVKLIPGSSEIVWTSCTEANSFFISGQARIPGERQKEKNTQLSGNECTGDYIAIMDSEMGRYCGSSFSEVSSKAKPYMMWANFNEYESITQVELDPDTGCPIGWVCISSDQPPAPGTTMEGTTTSTSTTTARPTGVCPTSCEKPTSMMDHIDSNNTGFCLDYHLN